MITASIQPCFIPWQGYFEQMLISEVFIYLDDVQYTKKDWRNRNVLLSPNGPKNVFVPVSNASRDILINEALISYNEQWADKIINQLANWYKKAPFYSEVMALISEPLRTEHQLLVDLNYELNAAILDYLVSDTKLVKSSDVPKTTDDKNKRIIEFCVAYDAHLLYDGKSAEDFIDKQAFEQAGIEVLFQDYEHTPYRQLWNNDFETHLSIIDLLMNEGKNAKSIILNNPNFPDNEELRERRSHVSSL